MLNKKFEFILLGIMLSFSLSLFFVSLSTSVSAYSAACSTACTTAYCFCTSDCSSGYFNIYSNSNCYGIPTKKVVISYGNFTFASQSNSTYGKILCSDGNISNCTYVNMTTYIPTTTTTTTSKTTTTTALLACPYDCCVSQPGYSNKICPTGQLCQGNYCVSQKTDCPNDCCVNDPKYNDKLCSDSSSSCDVNGKCVSPGPQINYYLIGGIALVIVIGVVAFYFIRDRIAGKRGSSNQEAYEALKRKWSGR